MKERLRKIAAAAGCCLMLCSCGTVPNINEKEIPSETGITENLDVDSKKRSGFGKDADYKKTDKKDDASAAASGTLPVFDPPENGRVVENTNIKKKTDDSDDEEEGETKTTAASNGKSEKNNKKDDRKPPKNPSPSELLDYMTLEEKVCQMFIVEPEALSGYVDAYAGDDTKAGINRYPVGGVIYFARHLYSQDQTIQMINNTQSYSKSKVGTGMFTAVDEEGGTVARCAQQLGTTAFSDMAYYGADNDGAAAYNIGNTIGNDLRGLGFNLDFAPVADVNINPMNELGTRIFSSDPEVTGNMVGNVVKGMQDAGVSATAKHFPGLGAEDGNTHNDSYVVIDRTLDQLRETEFVPFRKAIDNGVDFIMVGHQITTCSGDNLPGDLSYEICTNYLRNELGFRGLIVTDSQKMNTISNVYSSGDAAVMSIKAGVDVILIPYDIGSAVEGVCNAVKSGEISEGRIEDSVRKILELKKNMGLM